MSMIEVPTEIGFDDSECLGYDRNGDALMVRIRTWNEKTLRVRFLDAVAVRDCQPGDISGFYEYGGATAFLAETLARVYDEPPEKPPYRHFVFTDIDDQPSLEVIAEECMIETA